MALGDFTGSEVAAGNEAVPVAKRYALWVFLASLILLVTTGCERSRRESTVPNDQ